MTSQAADGPETVVASRRSKITPEREQEFYDAVLEQIRECGYDSLTMEGVATSTRCSKSTLYRQWKTKPQFVAAALRANRCPKFTGIDTGSLAGDLRAMARAAGNWSGPDNQLLQALGHAVMQDEELRDALRDALVEPEIASVREILGRAVERGRSPPTTRRWSSFPRSCSGLPACARFWRARKQMRRISHNSWRRS